MAVRDMLVVVVMLRTAGSPDTLILFVIATCTISLVWGVCANSCCESPGWFREEYYELDGLVENLSYCVPYAV